MSHTDVSKSRRQFLTYALAAVPAVTAFGAATLLPRARATVTGDTAGHPSAIYEPTYFTAMEWQFLLAAVDRLIPGSAAGPGAIELGVPVFIDRQMEDAYGYGGYWYMHGPFFPDAPPTLGYQLRFTPREMYRTGIAAVDGWCRNHHGHEFAMLDANERDAVLRGLELGQVALEPVPAQSFFAQLLQNTREGYFADPMYGGNKGMGSWKMIGFPGARADFMDWADQPGKVYPLGPVSIEGNKA